MAHMHEAKEACFYTSRGNVPRQYPWLSEDESCEVAVIGGGLTGCFAVWQLARAGIDAVLLTRKPVGFSSTAVENSVMGWQNELLLTRLAKAVGKDHAARTWALCGRALDELEQFSHGAEDFAFCRRDAFLYVSNPDEVNDLHTEYLMRKHNGFEVEYLERADAGEQFSFRLEAGILSPGAAGEADGYRLCHALTNAARDLGARIYENTVAVSIADTDDGKHVEAVTELGRRVRARKLVLAIGWRQEEYLRPLIARRTVFSMVTEPIEDFSGYCSRAVVRDATHQISLRTTDDGRILAYGLDCTLPDSEGRFSRLISADRIIERKYCELHTRAEEMLCGVGSLTPAFNFHGAYGTVKDGLPIVGSHPDYENVWFDLPSGPNAGLLALQAGRMLAALYKGHGATDAAAEESDLFSPMRRTL